MEGQRSAPTALGSAEEQAGVHGAVTLHSEVKAEPIDGGMMFTITGAPPVRDAIRRIALAHAATMNRVGGWQLAAAQIEGGATTAVKAPVAELAKLKGLGFMGVMTPRHAPPGPPPDDRARCPSHH
jgi:hypothetical protein